MGDPCWLPCQRWCPLQLNTIASDFMIQPPPSMESINDSPNLGISGKAFNLVAESKKLKVSRRGPILSSSLYVSCDRSDEALEASTDIPLAFNKQGCGDFPGSPVVETLFFSAGEVGLISGQGAEIPHAVQPENQNMKQKQRHGCVLSLQSCPTLCDAMDQSPPGSSVHAILQAKILEWVAMPSSRELPDPGIEPLSPALAGGFFTTSATWEAPVMKNLPATQEAQETWV